MIKMTKTEAMNCINCSKLLKSDKSIYTPYRHLFYSTCRDCMQTCSSCGFEIGYQKPNNFLSNNCCDLCQKETCRHCGVVLHCDRCNISCCEYCIEQDITVTCTNIQEKKKEVKRYK